MSRNTVIQDETVTQNDTSKSADIDAEAAAELEGVPDSLKEQGDGQAALEERIATLEAQLAEAKQDVLYARADTQNVRRRLEKDAQDARAYAATGFARDILSVSDNLTRALQAIPEDARNDEAWKGLVVGLEATGRELESVFGKHGISRIAAIGLPLDPNQHQAMIELPSDEAEPGTVVQELQAGYMIKDRLLRPALVAVAKKPD
ncbi:MAG: nucleotide exchange factor GrpE [Blastomonas sp.]|jgi:molecular chaperone GrpE|uniref:nucleotide exchange factor GrpE n=1 Tax=Blastomonas TaxID=150203 RepID=UPI000AD36B47|nr:nucleotide exchange factor GrpE [Sphingomonas ursincola]MBA4779398.1 nucleotide exchange factor GrpE [Blastomonas sp.]MCH2236833.1 nucleotide exchange factor GrpE [Blastomonas sp.]